MPVLRTTIRDAAHGRDRHGTVLPPAERDITQLADAHLPTSINAKTRRPSGSEMLPSPNGAGTTAPYRCLNAADMNAAWNREGGSMMIDVDRLTKRYGSKLAVDDLTFAVHPGKVTGFLGPNGAGKSTTMRMMLGLDRPSAGTARINGRDFTASPAPLHEVGALLDAKNVHGGRSAYNHLLSMAQSNGIPKERVTEVLALTGMDGAAHQRIGGFSLGMYQRLGIAAAMLGDPGVLIFDEPVNGLDPEGIVWIRTFMKSLASEGRTVLVSSHLMSEMALTADHLIVIGRGRLLADVSMEEFIQRHSHHRVRVRSPQQDVLARLVTIRGAQITHLDGYLEVSGLSREQVGDLAADNRVTIHELVEERASLEAAFMEMTHDSVEHQAAAGLATAA
jgi:ABC-2 type transport system ATP-binding protein